MNSLTELIATLEERPPMYIGQRSISCLAAYIDGWCDGREKPVDDAEKFHTFQNWLKKKFHVTTSQTWDRIILFQSQDESDALDNFFRLFREFETTLK